MKKYIDVFFGITYDELFPMAKKEGFDGFFSGEIFANEVEKLEKIELLARENKMEWETSHSTIPGSQTIWSKGKAGDEYCRTLLANIDNCKRFGVPLLVVHVSPDFSKEPSFDIGIGRLSPIVEYAKEKGVKIAFENIDSEEYLLAVLDYFKDPHVGFCYDCGHEACHTPGVRYLPRLGKRLFCTHLHDNDGKYDQHFLPFDGSIDFELMCSELKACGYNKNLTLELCYSDVYQKKCTKEEFVREAFIRLKKMDDMMK